MHARSTPRPQPRLRLVLEEHERERSELAHELHEQVAQALAAVLLSLDSLATTGASGSPASKIAPVRQQVADTLEYCRALAVSLRPPLLDEIGLVPALEQLADRAQAERVSVDRALDAMDLGPELQTELYRSVEEALASVAGRPTLAVSLDSAIPRVRISVRPLDAQPTIAVLGTLEARVELLGGRITASGGELVMHIPIDPGPGPAAVFPQPQPVEIPDGERPARA